jgi:hypothetical protein
MRYVAPPYPAPSPTFLHSSSIDSNTIINRSGRCITIEDADVFVHAALTTLAGTYALASAYAQLSVSLGATYSFDMMLDVIQQMGEFKLLENISLLEQNAKLLTDYDIARWNRNFELFNAYCSIHQSKFRASLKCSSASATQR